MPPPEKEAAFFIQYFFKAAFRIAWQNQLFANHCQYLFYLLRIDSYVVGMYKYIGE